MDSYTKDNKYKNKISEGDVSESSLRYKAESQEFPFSETLDALVFANDSFVAIPLPKLPSSPSPSPSPSSSSSTFVENAAFYHNALDEHILTFVIDQKANIQSISSSLCRLLAYSKDELLNQCWTVLQPRCHQQESFDTVWKGLCTGEKWHGEICFTARNCERVWLDTTLIPRCNESGSSDFILAICTDVTAVKHKLSVAQSFVESAIHDSQTTTGLLTADGEVLFFNKVALERSSVLSANILGRKIWDTPWLEGLATSKELIKESVKACVSGESQILQMECMLGGRSSDVSLVLRPLLGEDGSVSHLFLEAWDISLNIEVRKALQKSELKYKALADATNIGFAELNLDRQLISANRELLSMLGLSSASLMVGTRMDEWVAESDRPLYEKAVSTSIATKIFQRIELNLCRTDKTLLPVEVSLAQLVIEGQKKLLCFVGDIRERKAAQLRLQQSEGRLVLALAGSDAALWDWPPGEEVSYDIGWKHLLGYNEKDSNQDVPSWEEHLHPRDRKLVLDGFMEILLGLSPSFEEEYRLKHKSGKWIWVLGRGKVMQRNASGNPLRIAGTICDITAKKRAEEERLSMVNKLQQAEKLEAVGLLSAGMAHDFNNILVSVLGYADLASNEMKRYPEARLHHYVEQITNSGQRASELVQRLMLHGRKEIPNTAALSLAPLIEKVIPVIWGTVPSSMEIRRDLDESCSPVFIDPVLLHQLLINLCVNARDAMNNKGQITIRLYELDSASGDCATCMAKLTDPQVVLEVKDNGPGISAALQQQIFEPFFTTKEKDKGTGIGLASVHRIMHELGGHIVLDTAPGKGASFRLYFPIAKTPAIGI
ncbi:MAG: PAS domain S-box protein [Pseudomonadales bacterium]|nr:PAS domain S-box protein [Pseudomonadales bacterium]